MIIFTKRDGTVERFDMTLRTHADRFSLASSDPGWHASVTGVSVASDRSRVDLPLPKGLGSVTYDAATVAADDAVVAEVVGASVGDIYLRLMRYLSGDRFRMDVTRPGRRRWRS